jgi:hypothetical protein
LGRERLLPVAAPSLAERARARSVTADFLCGLPCIAYGETLPLVREFFQRVFDKAPDMQAAATAPCFRHRAQYRKTHSISPGTSLRCAIRAWFM